jgi:hypothetical protein
MMYACILFLLVIFGANASNITFSSQGLNPN